jgi:hypothetical protein
MFQENGLVSLIKNTNTVVEIYQHVGKQNFTIMSFLYGLKTNSNENTQEVSFL